MWTFTARNLGNLAGGSLAMLGVFGVAGCCCTHDKSAPPAQTAPAGGSAPATRPQGPQASAQPASGNLAVINTMCSIGGDDFGGGPHPAWLSRDWKGSEIGFCCNRCVAKFDKMADEQKDDVLKRAQANAAP